MKRTTVDLWVGVFVTAGVVALFVLALKVGNATTRNRVRWLSRSTPSSTTSAVSRCARR